MLTGLTSGEVEARVDEGRVNRPPPSAGRTIRGILRANLLTRFNAILGSLFVVVVIVGPPQDALFGVVLFVNTTIGIAQELRARRLLSRLAILTAPSAHAVRDGVRSELQRGTNRILQLVTWVMVPTGVALASS